MMKEQNQNAEKYEIPVWRKYTLSVQEAAKYFHIGDKKLRLMKIRMLTSFCGMVPVHRLNAECLNSLLTKNYLPYKNGKYTIDSEPGLWYNVGIIAWLFSMAVRLIERRTECQKLDEIIRVASY